MKRGLILLITLVGFCLFASAQPETVIIRRGKAINDTLFNKRLFYLKEFADSRITMNDGSIYNAKANVMTIDQAVAMIENGDTTRVLKEKDIAMFSGGGSLMYKIDGLYHQLIETNGEVSLVVVKKIDFAKEKLEGAYGASNETAAISRLTRMQFDILLLDDTEIVLGYQYKESLFLISKGRTYVPTQKNFERLFSKQKEDIEKFVIDNNIQFSRNNDVKALFNYLLL